MNIINSYRFAAGGITDPTDIAGLDLWLDASDSSTLAVQQNGTGGTPADDGQARYWADKSSNANNATISANGPTRRVAEINGLDTLYFDGTTNVLEGTADLTPRQTDDKTAFIVSLLAVTNANAIFSLYDTTTNGARGTLFSSTLVNTAYAIAGGIWQSSDDIQDTINASVLTMTQASTGDLHAAVGMRLDGVDLVRDAGTDRAFTNLSISYKVGGWVTTQKFNGDICEIIVYDNKLGVSDIQAVETYLAEKWGITLT